MKIKTAIAGVIIMLAAASQSLAAGLNEKYEAMSGFYSESKELSAVRIALIDTGIDTARLNKNQILEGESYVTEEGGDSVGHGTRIASLIIGADNGTDSISALAPNALLIPIVYYSKYPSGVAINGGIEGICRGIYDSVDRYNADIIVISSGITENDEALYEAVMYAEANNVTVISAAGNDGGDTPYYPASYPTVVSVGSVGEDMAVSEFSQKSGNITIMAPGEDLYGVSIKNGSFFDKFSGTSYACAYAAAALTRLLGEYPDMTPADFRWILQNTGRDILQIGYDTASGFGVIDAEKAVLEYKNILKHPSVPFYDVRISDWFYEGVQKAGEKGIMSGKSENFFSPNDFLTRGMLTAILYRMEGEPKAVYNMPFSDVLPEAYYSDAVLWAAAEGIVYGMTDTCFMPDECITREQAASILYRYFGKNGADTDLSCFSDSGSISGYARLALSWAVSEGIISGRSNGYLDPQGITTRAEAAVMISGLIDKIQVEEDYSNG